MSKRDQLDSYLKQVEKRLRLDTLLRGAAILTSVALIATTILVLVTNALAFSEGSVSGARAVLFCALAAALALGLALPLYALNPVANGSKDRSDAFPAIPGAPAHLRGPRRPPSRALHGVVGG